MTGRPARTRASLGDRLARWAPGSWLRFGDPGDERLGFLGEELAARALRAGGWRLLGRRLATPRGEVDILGRDGDELVCVEVKSGRLPRLPRRADAPAGPIDGELRWRPGGRFDRGRLERQAAAARWLARRVAWAPSAARVDLIEVLVRRGERARLVHRRGLWRTSLVRGRGGARSEPGGTTPPGTT